MDRGIDLDVIMPILNDYTESLINFGPNDSHYNVNKRARDALINNGMHFNGANELVLGLEALVATGVPDTDAYDKIINSALQTHLLSATGKLGGAAPPQELYKLAAEQAYDKQQRALPGGYEPVPGGTATVRAWKKASDPDLLIGVRGTDDARDMSANASLLYNGLRGTNRYKADEATVRKIVAAHPGAKVHLASHSLGAAVAREMENILPVATSRAFNAAFQPSTFSKPGVQERHYKGSDFLGQIGRYLPGAKHIVAPPDSSKSKWYDPRTWNAFKHHSLSGFGRKRKGGAMRRDRLGLPPDLVLRPSSTGVFPTMPHVRSIDFPATPAGRAAYRAAVRENQAADLHNKEVEALRHAGPGLGGSRFIGGSTSDPDMDMYSDANSRRRRRRVNDRTTFGQWQWIRRLATSPTAAFRNQILAVLPPGWRYSYVIDWPRTFAAWDSGTLERENDDGQIQGYHFRDDEPHSLTGIDEDLDLSSTTATPESVIETRSRNASVTEEPPVSDREDEMESGGSRKRRGPSLGGSRFIGGSTSDPDMEIMDDDIDPNARRRNRRYWDHMTFDIWTWLRRMATSPTAAFRDQILAVPPPGWQLSTLMDWPRTFAAWNSGTIERGEDEGRVQGYYLNDEEPQLLAGRDEELELSTPTATSATPESVIETRSRHASVTEEPPVSDREDEMESGGSRKRRRGGSRVLLRERRDVARFGDSPPTTFHASAPQQVADPYQRLSGGKNKRIKHNATFDAIVDKGIGMATGNRLDRGKVESIGDVVGSTIRNVLNPITGWNNPAKRTLPTGVTSESANQSLGNFFSSIGGGSNRNYSVVHKDW